MRINRSPTRRELRQFAVLWIVVFTVMGFELDRRGVAAPWPLILAATAITTGGLGLWSPAFMRRIWIGAMYATFPIGWVVSHVLLTATFVLVFLPIGLIMRAVGYDPLTRKLARDQPTYWVRRERRARPQDYFRQF